MSHPLRETVTVQFMDGERKLFYNMKAWSLIRKTTGFNVLNFKEDELQKLLMENLTAVLHAGLVTHDPQVTPEAIEESLYPGDYARILTAVTIAIRHSLQDPEKQAEATQPGEPDPTPPEAQRVI